MKKVILLFLVFVFVISANPISQDCVFKGKKLFGRVRHVNAFADIRVRHVNAFTDLRVKVVNFNPDRCGEWMFVQSGEDFSVEFVDAFEDLKIEYVQAYPGIN